MFLFFLLKKNTFLKREKKNNGTNKHSKDENDNNKSTKGHLHYPRFLCNVSLFFSLSSLGIGGIPFGPCPTTSESSARSVSWFGQIKAHIPRA